MNGLRILLIDDDRDEYLLAREMLAASMNPFEQPYPGRIYLSWVDTYEAGLEAIQKGRYDAYLIDYHLGPRTGLELLRQAVAQGCTAPLILLTGHGNYATDLEAMQAGAADYLTKGELTASLLERSLRYALEQKRIEAALQQAHAELEARVQERTQELAIANHRLESANAGLRAEIDERQRAEEALESERKRLFTLLDELPAFVWLQAPDHTIRFANCQFQERFGRPDGKFCYQLMRQRATPCPDCLPAQVLADKNPVEWEWSLDDGRSYQMYNYPFTDSDGSPLVMELGIDITRRKQAEEKLDSYNQELLALSVAERSQRHLAEGLVKAAIALNTSLNLDEVLDRILEQIQGVLPCRAMAIALLDEDGTNLYAARSRGMEDLPETRRSLETPFPLEKSPVLARMARTRQPVLLAETHEGPDWPSMAGFEWVRSYAGAPLEGDRQVIGFLNIFSDEPGFFTQENVQALAAFAANAQIAIQNASLYRELQNALDQEQAIRAQLIHAEKFAAMGRMVASVAHELNNPLQTIRNCLYLSRQDTPPESPMNEYLEIASSETQRLANLVTQLRELYRPRNNIQMGPVQVFSVLDEVHALLTSHLKSQHVTWQQVTPPPGPAWVKGISDQLKQVFLNIGTNAIEAMQPDGGYLYLHTLESEDGSQVGIAFEDTGPGIPAQHINRLFEPFFTTKVHGSGLGLPICYEIIERHGGRLTVESRLDQGATFTIWLPRLRSDETLPDERKGN